MAACTPGFLWSQRSLSFLFHDSDGRCGQETAEEIYHLARARAARNEKGPAGAWTASTEFLRMAATDGGGRASRVGGLGGEDVLSGYILLDVVVHVHCACCCGWMMNGQLNSSSLISSSCVNWPVCPSRHAIFFFCRSRPRSFQDSRLAQEQLPFNLFHDASISSTRRCQGRCAVAQ